MRSQSWKRPLAWTLSTLLAFCLAPVTVEAAELLEESEAIEVSQVEAPAEAEATPEIEEIAEAQVAPDEAVAEAEAAPETEATPDESDATAVMENADSSDIAEAEEAVAAIETTSPANAGASGGGTETRIELNSGATRSADFVSADQAFDTSQGTYQLVMSGLKEENREALVEALALFFEAGSDTPLTLVDAAFADAEKYDIDPDVNPLTGEGYYDSRHCWAGSASNMLWVSGWASRLVNPMTGELFASEDEVFEYFNASFSDGGSENKAGIDWFFMGEYFHVTYSGGTARLIDSKNPEDGLMKEFVSTLAQQQFELIDSSGHPELIEQILRNGAAADTGDAAVIEACIGLIHDRELTKSTHSVTAAGLIVDPNAQTLSERYRAIIIVDSDNDGTPSERMGKGLPDYNPTVAEKNTDKEARPNTVTVYGLELIDATTKAGQTASCWKILGYGKEHESGAEWVIYQLNALPLYDEGLVARNTEQYGTKTVVSDVDLVVETVYTTDNPEPIKDLYWFNLDDEMVTEFAQGELVNLGFLLQNRSAIVLDEAKADGQELLASWKVVRDADGVVVAEGRSVCELPVPGRYECGCVAALNALDGGAATWEPGAYTAVLEINADRAIVEAYYLNNVPVEAHFVVTSSGEPAPDEPASDEQGSGEKQSPNDKNAATPAKPPTTDETSAQPNSPSELVTQTASDSPSRHTVASAASTQVAAIVLPKTGDANESLQQLALALVVAALVSLTLAAASRNSRRAA